MLHARAQVDIAPYAEEHHQQVLQVMARAFTDHVLHVAIFRKESLKLNQAMFRFGLSMVQGRRVVAKDEHGETIVGFAHWADETLCQRPLPDLLPLLPGMLFGLGGRNTGRLARFFSLVADHDPDEPHLHLGPVGVDPRAQGRGIGTALMAPYMDDLEESGRAGWLETHGEANIRFYRRFGFEVVDDAELFGITTVFMRRPPG